MSVRVDFRGPETQVLDVPQGRWFVLGDRPVAPDELPDPLAVPMKWIPFGDRFEELTAVFLPLDPAGSLPCQAYRSLFSGYELFRAETPDGGFLLTDDFRAAGRAAGKKPLPVASIADYLLFQYPAGNDTFLPGVTRLGPGEALSAHPAETGRTTLRQVERLRLPPKVSASEALEMARETLSAAVGKALEGAENAAVLFSGGIDSTLVSFFGGNRAIALHAAIDSPELAYEEEYAQVSSREMGMPLVRVLFPERDFLENLQDAMAKLGRPFPVTHFQVIFNNRLFRLPYDLFLSGDIADRLFGHELESTGHGPDTPVSRLTRYCPVDLLCGMFGRELVESRLKLYEEALEKLAGPGFEELNVSRKTDLLVFFGLNYWVHYFRPLAAAFGKRFIAPFGRKAVFEAALSCPAGHGLGGGHPKPLLREILGERLPGYPFEGRKGGSGVPRTRFCQEGPLKDFFSRHDLPAGIDARFGRVFREPAWETSSLVLQAACYRIWEETR